MQVLALEYRHGENLAVDTAGNLELSEIEEPISEDKDYTKIVSGSPSERRTVLDSLVGTILSQNTTDNNSKRAFASLKRAFPTWEEVRSVLGIGFGCVNMLRFLIVSYLVVYVTYVSFTVIKLLQLSNKNLEYRYVLA